jgi:hypothetical protein
MNNPEIYCPKCKARLFEPIFNQPGLLPCPACETPLHIEIFPAFFREIAQGRDAEAVMIEGESSCFYHPQKKAVVPCDACGRFLCALCDCEVKGQHFCPGCLEAGQKKRNIQGLENMRVLHSRQALVLAIIPLFITGLAAIYVALRYRKEPGSLVAPMRWAFPVALILGSLQTLAFLFLMIRAFVI